MTERRRFNRQERDALALVAGNQCEACGASLADGFHADHRHPWSKGGETKTNNGQALCPTCNLKKGDKRWQQK